jgi:hypothetical protein
MMEVDCETPHYALHYDARYGIGFIRRKSDGIETPLITGSDMTELRRTLNRAKTNATSKRRLYRPFAEIADLLLGEYFAQ